MLQNEIETKLKEFIDPYLGKDLIAAKVVKEIAVKDQAINLHLQYGFPIEDIKPLIIKALNIFLSKYVPDFSIAIKISTQIDVHTGTQNLPPLTQIKNIIAVGSGKGGVGKSTVALNMALALQKAGAEVGILDADVYGPSLPTLLGNVGAKASAVEKILQPIKRFDIQTMSMGYLVGVKAPIVWRGPMLGKAMHQLIQETNWTALDYLIIDLPPGTGDVQLSLCQKVPLSGAVIVTTPQDVALADVRRACEMFNTMHVPLLGVVENMSTHSCTQCGHIEKIFGEGGGESLAKEYDLPVLGYLPLMLEIRELTDKGIPPMLQADNISYTQEFLDIARKAAAILSLQTKNYMARFPKVVVKHT